jgi:hypothetical protein
MRIICLLVFVQRVFSQGSLRTTEEMPFKYKDLLGYNVSRPHVVRPYHDLSAGDQYGKHLFIFLKVPLHLYYV